MNGKRNWVFPDPSFSFLHSVNFAGKLEDFFFFFFLNVCVVFVIYS